VSLATGTCMRGMQAIVLRSRPACRHCLLAGP
jgi:hypothetical protein